MPCNAEKAYAECRESCGKNGITASAENQPERLQELGRTSLPKRRTEPPLRSNLQNDRLDAYSKCGTNVPTASTIHIVLQLLLVFIVGLLRTRK
jgi:hypothetical protein